MRSSLSVVLAGALLAQLHPPTSHTLHDFEYSRGVVVQALSPPANACVVLDGNVFAHATGALSDLRLFNVAGTAEIPYAVTLSSTADTSDAAIVSNATSKVPGRVSFDLGMPQRPYSAVDLTLNLRDFVARAHVVGLRSRGETHPIFLGDFTLFDLTEQRLGRDTHLPIAESTFPYLRIALTFKPTGRTPLAEIPAVLSAQVPPDRQEQTLYTSVAETSDLLQNSQQTIATFHVPAHVPVERVTFDLKPSDKTNFSRSVSISASPELADGAKSKPSETLFGQISRVHLGQAGFPLAYDSLSIPAIFASNAQSPAVVRVALQNGDQPPLQIRQVRLEMRQRKLCFPAAAGTLTMVYGSATAQAPAYDFARSFNASAATRQAALLPEQKNRLYVASVKSKSRFARSPAFFGLSLLVALCLLAVIAFRALHRGHHNSLHR